MTKKDGRVKAFEVKENWMKAFKDTFWSDGKDHWTYVEKEDKTFQKFIWDPVKNKENMYYHDKFPLIVAVPAYFDEFALEIYDDVHSNYDFSKKKGEKEERYQLVGIEGKNKTEVLFVSYTEPKGKDEVRLISTRRAESPERKLYYENREHLLDIETPKKNRDSNRKPPKKR